MLIKRLLAAFLAAMLICGAGACVRAESAPVEEEDFFGDYADFGFAFDDEGYSGEWVEVREAMIEFCLPEGWHPTQTSEGALYSAANGDGSVSLSIRLAAADANDLTAWGAANLGSFETDEANFYDVLVVEGESSVSVYAAVSEKGLLAFDFARNDAEALTREFALQIVGTACAIWGDDDVIVDDDDGVFEFGDGFAEDFD